MALFPPVLLGPSKQPHKVEIMSLPRKRKPTVLTVRPTNVTTRKRQPETAVIQPHGAGNESIAAWNARFTPAILVGGGLAIATWLASFAASYASTTASFWIGLLGLLATGAMIYRELFRAGLIPHWIVGVCVALAPLLLAGVFKILSVLLASFLNLPSFHFISPAFVAAIGVGLVIGAAAHCLGLLTPAHGR